MSARPRTPLATGPRQTAGREHLVPTRAHECWPAEPAYELPQPRPAAPTARAPATGNPHPTPCCSQAQRHNNGGTRGPTQNTPPISDAGRSTRGHQGAGTQRRRRRPPTRGSWHGLRPGGNTGWWEMAAPDRSRPWLLLLRSTDPGSSGAPTLGCSSGAPTLAPEEHRP